MKPLLTFGGICLLVILSTVIAGCTTPSAPVATPVPTTAAPATPAATPLPVTSAMAAATPTPIQYATYTCSTYGISLAYPSDWQMQGSGDLALRDYGKTTANLVNLFTPGTGSYAIFSVDIDPAPTSDLEAYFNSAVVALQKTYPKLTLNGHNAQLRVSGKNAYRVDYQVPTEGTSQTSYGFQVYTIVDNTPYIFTYQAQNLVPTDKVYNDNLDDAQAIIKSVSISPVTVSEKSR